MRLAGAIGDEPVTLALFDHPENVGFPTYWVARGYGPLGPNPIAPSVFAEVEPMHFELDARADAFADEVA